MDLSSCLNLLQADTGLLSFGGFLPSLGVAFLIYALVTRQLATIQDDGEEFGTAGEENEWLGGPTSEWLGV